MNFNQDDNNFYIFDSKEDFVKHYIFKQDYKSIRYSQYLDCKKFVNEWQILKYKFNPLQNGKILVSPL